MMLGGEVKLKAIDSLLGTEIRFEKGEKEE